MTGGAVGAGVEDTVGSLEATEGGGMVWPGGEVAGLGAVGVSGRTGPAGLLAVTSVGLIGSLGVESGVEAT